MDNVKNKAEYIIASINEFAKRHKLTDKIGRAHV